MVRKQSKKGSDTNDGFFEDPFVIDKASFRPAKVANRIKEELLLLVPDAIRDPKLAKCGSVTVTDVLCANDLRNATVRFTIIGDVPVAKGKVLTDEEKAKLRSNKAKDAEMVLNKAARFLRKELSEKLGIKYTPLLHFVFDRGMDHSLKIHEILKNVSPTTSDSEES